MKKISILSLAIVSAAMGTSAQAQYLLNGDFETLTGLAEPAQTFTAWTESAGSSASNAPVAISGSASAKLSFVTAGSMLQTLTDPNGDLTHFRFDMDFGASDPGTGTARSFQLNLRHNVATTDQIALRIIDSANDGLGEVQLFNNSSWVTIMTDAVTFSPNTSSLLVHHLTIDGDYRTVPTYNVFFDSFSVLGRTEFQGVVPAPGTTMKQVRFETGNYAAGSFSVVDNVAVVPEPGTFGLFALAGLSLLGFNRFRKN